MTEQQQQQPVTTSLLKERFVFGDALANKVQGKSFYPQTTYTKQEADAALGLFKLSGRKDVHMFVLCEVPQTVQGVPDEVDS
jgi:hypothetical protein